MPALTSYKLYLASVLCSWLWVKAIKLVVYCFDYHSSKLWFIAQNETETYKLVLKWNLVLLKEQELLASVQSKTTSFWSVLAYCVTKQSWYKTLLVERFLLHCSRDFFKFGCVCTSLVLKVFLTKFELFWYPMKHCLGCLIYLLNGNKNERLNGRLKSSQSMLTKTGCPNLLYACDFLCFNVMNY